LLEPELGQQLAQVWEPQLSAAQMSRGQRVEQQAPSRLAQSASRQWYRWV